MYFGSVRFFKHVIVAVVIILIIVPCVICFVLGAQLNEQKEENEKLRAEIGSGRIEEYNTRYEADQMFELYRDKLDDKEGFLQRVYGYDPGEYSLALFSGEAVIPDATDAPVTEPAASTAAPETSGDSEPEAVQAMAESTDGVAETTEAPEEVPEFTHTEASGGTTNVRAAYEMMYPELYADVPENIVYNEDMDYVYLTFDDGPSKYTDSILNYLEMYDLKATFFVVPDGSDESNARLKRIANAGHTIGIHTASHEYNKIYESVEAYLDDFKLAYDRVYAATGIKCTLFRFPGGSINDYNESIRDDLIAEMTRRGFIYFDWNVDSSDALGATWTEMYNNVTSQTKACNRAVILMHDYNGGYNTILVLEDIIRWLISNERGYKLDKLTEFVKPVQF